MQRRWLGNLILLLVAGVLGLVVWQAQSPALQPLTGLEPGQISRIDISDLSGRQVQLTKQAGQWHLGSGMADQVRVVQLLGISRTQSLERFAVPADLRPFGLEPAPIRLRLDDLTLDFGATDPINGWRYVRIGGTIHLIADGYYHHLTAAPESWLERE